MNFDGLVGPTHNYAGMAKGNLASAQHRDLASNPKGAAKQGLQKMRKMMALGIPQGVLPPHERPFVPALRSLGFSGARDADVLAQAASQAPRLLRATSSASAMWTANAATVSPSQDCSDGRTHLTPANLQAALHRHLETEQTTAFLRRIFAGASFVVHDALPATWTLADEGAANHTRFCWDGGALQLFVFGRDDTGAGPRRFPARQSAAASRAIARRHLLSPENTLFLQQNPDAIDAGVFHHDVIGVGHRDYCLVHEKAFAEADANERILRQSGGAVHVRVVRDDALGLDEAVRTYLFNSQLVCDASGKMILIAPEEVAASERASAIVTELLEENHGPSEVAYLPLRESMQNGGGPACLRLRVPLSNAELAQMSSPCLLNEARLEALEAWVDRHYRDALQGTDLHDPALLQESREALDDLTQLLDLGSIYPFQQN